jgi:hypothetical protein
MIYEQQDTLNNSFTPNNVKLKRGTFQAICNGFDRVDLHNLKPLYQANESDFGMISIEFGLENGEVIKSDIHGGNCL